MVFINPWTYYIINDKMPSLYTGDSNEDKKILYILIYWLILSSIFLFSSIWLVPYMISFFMDNNIINLFPFVWFIILVFYIIMIYFGCKKILK